MSRVLIVARGFPPSSDPTSYRWLRFAGGLARRGWDVEVLTAGEAPRPEYYDPALLSRIPAGITVHRAYPGLYQPRVWRARMARSAAAPTPAGNGAARAAAATLPTPRTLLRDLDDRIHELKIPDPTFEWIAPGVLLGLRVLAQRRFDLIVSSAAPFSSHVVAARLHAWTRVPWVGDFSDPYADNPFSRRSGWRHRLDRRMERSWFRSMAGAIVPVPEMKDLFAAQHPEFTGPVHVIPYGFDQSLYETLAPHRFDGFTIVHTGTFYAGLRDPEPFFQALAAVKELPIRVVHAGVLQPEWTTTLERLGIADRFQVLGLLPREAITPLQLGASCLLLIGNRGGLQLPGKLLDYLGARRPIFALRNDAHDIAADLVASRGAGHVVPNDPEAIAAGLRQMFEWSCDGSLGGRFLHDGAPEFAWTRLEERLDEALRGHLTGTRAGRP